MSLGLIYRQTIEEKKSKIFSLSYYKKKRKNTVKVQLSFFEILEDTTCSQIHIFTIAKNKTKTKKQLCQNCLKLCQMYFVHYGRESGQITVLISIVGLILHIANISFQRLTAHFLSKCSILSIKCRENELCLHNFFV